MKTYTFALKIRNYLPDFFIKVNIDMNYIETEYLFGPYKHNLLMTKTGDYKETVFRKDKELTSFKSPGGLYKQFTPIEVDKGKNLNYTNSNFVIGAGNGFFGLGITKEERAEDAYISVWCSEKGFYGCSVIKDSFLRVLDLNFNPLTNSEYIQKSTSVFQLND